MAEGGFVSNLKSGVFRNKGGRRFLVFSGVVMAGAVGIVMFGGGGEQPASSQIAIPPTTQTIQGGSQVSSQYAENLRAADRQRLEAAERDGGSTQPTLVAVPNGNGPMIVPVQLAV
ncbi:hypothetical protein ACFPYM_22420, partial [Methylobacterium hispanicum]